MLSHYSLIRTFLVAKMRLLIRLEQIMKIKKAYLRFILPMVIKMPQFMSYDEICLKQVLAKLAWTN